MIPISLKQVAEAVAGQMVGAADGGEIRRVIHDSREIASGDLFVAVRGGRLDGHQFVPQAIERGAAGCLCDRTWFTEFEPSASSPIVVVEDTITALGRLASWYRQRIISRATVVVAVTGSNGKTTTKHMLDHVLKGSLRGRCAPKSFNNHIGVPLTLLSAEADDRYLIVEVGMNAPGEIAALSSIIQPDVAIITSIGEAHLLGMESIEAIASEKTSILGFVQPRGLAVVNVDRSEIRPLLRTDSRVKMLTFGTDASARLRVSLRAGDIASSCFLLDDRFEIELNIPGVHHAGNAAATFAVGRWFGISPEEIIERLRTFQAVDGRTQRIELGGITVIDDSYNANPSSMAAAIDTLALVRSGRRVFVMGDMFELGLRSAAYHQDMARRVAEADIEVLVAVGPLAVEAARNLSLPARSMRIIPCEDAASAGAALPAVLAPGDTVWIKGSRGMQLDRVVHLLKSAYASVVAAA
jgi:UDP-N-acetylmuramoyl-tripeptide--D-alanyl-D-alanine ligase